MITFSVLPAATVRFAMQNKNSADNRARRKMLMPVPSEMNAQSTCWKCTRPAPQSAFPLRLRVSAVNIDCTQSLDQNSNDRVVCFLFFLVTTAAVVAVFTAAAGPLANVPGEIAVVALEAAVTALLNGACGCKTVSA